MDALALLRDQAATADDLLTQVAEKVTPQQSSWRPEGSTVNRIGVSYLHIYHSEDGLVQRSQGKPALFESGGWQARFGIDPAAIWTTTASPDFDALRAYATEVREATRSYLKQLDPAVLEEEIESPRGKRSRAAGLSLLLVVHKASHMGEIAGLLGVQGVKGFPF
ncbi:MAG: DinB family protein [Dehalococcoidia bacterium]